MGSHCSIQDLFRAVQVLATDDPYCRNLPCIRHGVRVVVHPALGVQTQGHIRFEAVRCASFSRGNMRNYTARQMPQARFISLAAQNFRPSAGLRFGIRTRRAVKIESSLVQGITAAKPNKNHKTHRQPL